MKKKLIVIDAGWGQMRGHHLATALLISDICAKNGIEIHFFTDEQLKQHYQPGTLNAKVDPVLFDVLYFPASFKPPSPERVEYCIMKGPELAERMARFITPHLTPETVLLSHSANPVVIYALGRWLDTIPREQRPPAVINIQNHISGHEIDRALYSAVLRLFLRHPYTRVFGSNANIATLLADYAGREDVKIFPLPYEYPDFKGLSPCSSPVFGFAGEARPEKNMRIFPGAMRAYIEQGGSGNFAVQAHYVQEFPETVAIRKELEALARRHPDRIALIPEPLYGREYYRHIASCDALMLPYLPERYQGRISQVVLDAVAMGTACLVCRGSSLECDLAPYDNGSLSMPDHSEQSLTDAFFAFEKSWHERSEKARAAARRMQAYHTMQAYIDVTFDVAEEYPFPDMALCDFYGVPRTGGAACAS